jgi:hypothetical protein
MAAREMATVTRVAGNKEGDGKGARGGGMMVAMGHGLCVFLCVDRPQKIR